MLSELSTVSPAIKHLPASRVIVWLTISTWSKYIWKRPMRTNATQNDLFHRFVTLSNIVLWTLNVQLCRLRFIICNECGLWITGKNQANQYMTWHTRSGNAFLRLVVAWHRRMKWFSMQILDAKGKSLSMRFRATLRAVLLTTSRRHVAFERHNTQWTVHAAVAEHLSCLKRHTKTVLSGLRKFIEFIKPTIEYSTCFVQGYPVHKCYFSLL